MNCTDYRGCPITGANGQALDAFELGLADFLAWRGNPRARMDAALAFAPHFVMAHVLRAYTHLCSREPSGRANAASVVESIEATSMCAREQMHLSAIRAAVAGDLTAASSILADILAVHPLDAVALPVAHAFDYLAGRTDQLAARVSAVRPAWSATLPGYHAVLAMHAFGLSETGDPERAMEAADRALEINPLDARAHHVIAHAFEARRDPEGGIQWLRSSEAKWSGDTAVATHCWWHLALFHLDAGAADFALALYDRRVFRGGSSAVSDLIDASSLLWRLKLKGTNVTPRWETLSCQWEDRIKDGFCSFNDLHAMISFVGACRWDLAENLVAELSAIRPRSKDYAVLNRLVGLPACRALLAFGRGDNASAIRLLGMLPQVAHRIGGSHAQRDVLHLTLAAAVERIRRSPYRLQSAA